MYAPAFPHKDQHLPGQDELDPQQGQGAAGCLDGEVHAVFREDENA